MHKRSQPALLGLLFVALFVARSVATSADDPTVDDATVEADRRRRVAELRGLVASLQVSMLPPDAARVSPPVELAKGPSLIYADNSRQLAASVLWVCLSNEMPVGLVAAEVNEDASRRTFEFSSLSRSRMQLSSQDGVWKSRTAAFTHQPFPASPGENTLEVGDTRAKRLQQMKRLADRFAAVEQHRSEGRIELRRLASPVFRHAEAARHDGGLFAFANGTNPEVVLWITADGAQGKEQWTYGLAALTSERVTVSLDQREIWKEDRFTMPGTRDTYVNGHFQADDPSKSDQQQRSKGTDQ